MYFIGTLAFSLPIPMSYDTPLGWLTIAMQISGFALSTVSHAVLAPRRLIVARCLMDLGSVALHSTGMWAMQLLPPIGYDLLVFVLFVVIAIVASMVALSIALQWARKLFRLRYGGDSAPRSSWSRHLWNALYGHDGHDHCAEQHLHGQTAVHI
jgi:NO-binding membrane sensor protein with MHYT domain